MIRKNIVKKIAKLNKSVDDWQSDGDYVLVIGKEINRCNRRVISNMAISNVAIGMFIYLPSLIFFIYIIRWFFAAPHPEFPGECDKKLNLLGLPLCLVIRSNTTAMLKFIINFACFLFAKWINNK